MARRSRRRNNSQRTDIEAHYEDVRQGGTHEMNTRTPGINGEATRAGGSNAPAVQADHENQPGSRIGSSTRLLARAQRDGPSNSGDGRQPGRRTSSYTTQLTPVESETPPVIGDFDDNANAFWSLHMKEAKSHDEARIQSIKDDMDSVLIFAGLFSAALISFIIDKIQDLQVNPAQQMVYYQQQVVHLLAQISTQVSSVAPQVSIPSTPLPPYPNFSPASSDVRINAFWFMSLVFSLSAALFATLVQQWVRNYMHVFQRYSNPLKSARLRQYLYEGVEGWYMPMVADSVPSLVHVSLFLFFLGVCDMLFALNTTVGVTSIVPISVCGLLYVLMMFAPIISPKSPYQNPFSSMIWYLMQKAFPRCYLDRGPDGVLKNVSPEMSTGKAQLAMEENVERKKRDVQAIQWLIDNSTDDNDMITSAMAIPGTFTSKWGVEVWKKVLEVKHQEDANPGPNDLSVRSQADAVSALPTQSHGSPYPRHTFHPLSLLRPFGHILGIHTADDIPRDVVDQSITHTPNHPHVARDPAIDYLCRRVPHMLDTYNNRSLFASTELWRMRARGCVETVALLVFGANVKLEQFGDPKDLGRLLRELGEIEKTREKLAVGSDGSFVTRWTYLSLMVVPRCYDDTIKWSATLAIEGLSMFQIGDDGDQINSGDDRAFENSRKIDDFFETAKQYCVYRLEEVFGGRTEEQVREVLGRDREAITSKLEGVALAADQIEGIDRSISEVNNMVNLGLSEYLPGLSFDQFNETELIHPNQFFNLPVAEGREFTPPFVFLGQRLRFLCSYAPKLRAIIDGQGNGQQVRESLRTLWIDAEHNRSVVGHQHLMELQLCRLLDLRDGGGFGLSVELFFHSLAKLLSMAQSQDTHSAFYIGTFRSIASGWKQQQQRSIGTQRVILNLVCDIAIYDRHVFPDKFTFPRDITTELLVLLEKMTEVQSSSHIDDVMKQLRAPLISYNDRWFAKELISRLGARDLGRG